MVPHVQKRQVFSMLQTFLVPVDHDHVSDLFAGWTLQESERLYGDASENRQGQGLTQKVVETADVFFVNGDILGPYVSYEIIFCLLNCYNIHDVSDFLNS